MRTQETESAINSLCITGHFETLHRIIKNIPGSTTVLISDKPAEKKRQELLKRLKSERPSAGTLSRSRD